jgi:hypothetical protein
MEKAQSPDKLRCPCCGESQPVAETPLLRAEAEWLATGAFDDRRPPGWSVEAAALQTWCDFTPYFAFIDARLTCRDCGRSFVFSAAEQRYWYETLKSWVQSRPKQCLACRRVRRARRREAREEQGLRDAGS